MSRPAIEPAPPPAVGARHRRIDLAVVTGIAALWSLVGIDRKPFWLDEGMTAGAVNQFSRIPEYGNSMPAYYAFIAVVGQASTQNWWLRLWSVVFALAALPLVYRFGEKLGGRTVARLGTLLTCTSYFVARYSQEARSFTLLLLVTTVGWWSLVSWVATDGTEARRWRRVFGVTTVLALLVHGMAALVLISQLAALLVRPDRRTRLDALIPTLGAWFSVLAGLIALGALNHASTVKPLSPTQLHQTLAQVVGPALLTQVVLGLGVVVGAWFATASWRSGRRDDQAWTELCVAIWALLPVVVLVTLSVVRPYLVARYLIGSAPALALLVAIAVTRLPRRPIVIGAVAALLVAAQVSSRIDMARETVDDWPAAARHVATGVESGDVVIFPTPWLRMPFDHAWSHLDGTPDPPQALYPAERIGIPLFWYPDADEDATERIIADQAPPRIWLVGEVTAAWGDIFDSFMRQPIVADYREVERWTFEGDVWVALLERS